MEEVQQLSAKMAKMSISVTQPRSPTPERRQQRVSFHDEVDASARRYSAAQLYLLLEGRGALSTSSPTAYSVSQVLAATVVVFMG